MNIFASLKKYAAKWSVKESRAFTAEEIAAVQSASVVSSQYGNSVCFIMMGGGQCYIPCDRDCTLGVGESVNLAEAKLTVLTKEGEDDILRITI